MSDPQAISRIYIEIVAAIPTGELIEDIVAALEKVKADIQSGASADDGDDDEGYLYDDPQDVEGPHHEHRL